MVWERIKLVLRRVVAWWIDAFAAAAVLLVLKWLFNLVTGNALTATAGDLYDIIGLALIFYIYRVALEAQWKSSLGKWSLKLEVITPHAGVWGAMVRNSWILLTMIAATGMPYVEPVILGVLGVSTLLLGRSVFDLAAGAFVEPRLDDPLELHNPMKR